MEQLRAIFIEAGNEEGNAKRSAHDGFLTISTFTETQGQVANGLGGALDAEGLVVVEGVTLALDAGVLNHGAGVGLQAGHGAANVAVNLDNLFDGRGFEEGRRHALLDAEDDAFRGGYADGCGTQLDGFERVFDLEEAAFWGEGVDSSICKGTA